MSQKHVVVNFSSKNSLNVKPDQYRTKIEWFIVSETSHPTENLFH